MAMRKKIFLFDFDGPLTSADTLVAFIRYVFGTWRMLAGFAVFSPLLVLMRMGVYPNYRAKQRLFAWYFEGMPIDEFDSCCRRFAADNSRLMRLKALDKLRAVFAEGYTVCVVSASIDNWVRPFFDTLTRNSHSDFHVLGTKVETDAERRLTGRFTTPNCYGAEKVNRILELMPGLKERRSDYHVVAYGDSRGDREMLEFADEAHYKPFK